MIFCLDDVGTTNLVVTYVHVQKLN